MKKAIIAAVFALTLATPVLAQAASGCTGDYRVYKAYVWTGSYYAWYQNFLSANSVISAIQANPSVSGKVTSMDVSCDARSTWTFSNGIITQIR